MNNKKYSGLRSVSNFFPKEVKNLLRKRGFFELELLKNWIEIVDKIRSTLIPLFLLNLNQEKGITVQILL